MTDNEEQKRAAAYRPAASDYEFLMGDSMRGANMIGADWSFRILGSQSIIGLESGFFLDNSAELNAEATPAPTGIDAPAHYDFRNGLLASKKKGRIGGP